MFQFKLTATVSLEPEPTYEAENATAQSPGRGVNAKKRKTM